jgi:hypothetical protein
MDSKAEKGVATIFMWALGCIAGGVLGGILLMPLGLKALAESNGSNITGVVFVALGPLVFVVGLILAVVGLVVGFQAGKIDSGPRQIPSVQVRSRFAVNEIGEMIFGNFEYDAPGGELFVQVMFPDGHIEELKTAWGVFCQCGEGMKGAATIQGDWLSSFVPVIAPTTLGTDPYDRRG